MRWSVGFTSARAVLGVDLSTFRAGGVFASPGLEVGGRARGLTYCHGQHLVYAAFLLKLYTSRFLYDRTKGAQGLKKYVYRQ